MAEKRRVWRFFRHLVDNAADVGHEAHVEHAVGLVEDQMLDGVELDRALLEIIEQAAGRGDKDVGAALELRFLFAVADAAIDDGGAEVAEAGVVARGLVDLHGELAGGLEDEDPRTLGTVLLEEREQREHERGGLAGAGLRGADDVLAGEDEREGLKLDFGGIEKSHRLHAVDHVVGKAEILKRHDG